MMPFLLLCSLLTESPAAGTEAFSLLKLDPSVRVLALGGTFTGLCDDANSIWYNPAGLSNLTFGEGVFGYQAGLAKIQRGTTILAYPFKRWTWALGVFYSAAQVESYSRENIFRGDIVVQSALPAIACAWQLSRSVSLGASIKGLYENLSLSWGRGIGFDFGASIQPVRFFKLGACIQNTGPGFFYPNDQWFDIPKNLLLGVGINVFPNLSVLSDVNFFISRTVDYHIGIEYQWHDLVTLRTGYRTGPQSLPALGWSSGLSIGLGLRKQRWSVDYAFLPYGVLGITHSVAVNMTFGRAPQSGDVLVKVIDAQTQKPIAAHLSFAGIKNFQGTTHPKTGTYTHHWLPVGLLKIKTTSAGYDERSDLVTIENGRLVKKLIPLAKIPLGSVKGLVYDALTRKPVSAQIHYQGLTKGTVKDDLEFGAYKIETVPTGEYLVRIEPLESTYLAQSRRLTLKPGEESIQDFALSRQISPTILVSVNLTFEIGKAQLLPSAYEILDRVGKILLDNSDLTIEIGGHTDSIPIQTKECPSNLELSQARAGTVRQYLLSKFKLSPERLLTHGYGDTVPIAPNASPEGRAMNRRTEFRIVSKKSK